MTAIDRTVFRTTDPRVLEVLAQSKTDYEGHAVRLTAWRDERSPEGRPRAIHYLSGNAWIGGQDTVRGLEHFDGVEPPEGWRYYVKEAFLRPNPKTAAGKAEEQVLRGVQYPRHPRRRLIHLGMPYCIHAGMAVNTYALDDRDGVVYVVWHVAPEHLTGSELNTSRSGNEPSVREVDPAIWQRVPLSEYIAEIEARESVSTP